MIHFRSVANLLLVGVLCQFGDSLAEEAIKSETANWNRLTYQATAFFVTAETTISLKSMDNATAMKQLGQFDAKDLLMPAAEKIMNIDIFTDEFGKQLNNQVWFENNGRTLQKSRITRGDKNEIKLYRYAQCGFYKLRKRFSDEKFDSNFSNWQTEKRKFKAFPPEACDGKVVVDSNTLLYLVSTLNLKNVGDQYEFYLEADGQAVKVKFVVKKNTKIRADYTTTDSTGKKGSIDKQVDVLQIQLSPVDNNKNMQDEIELLGLKNRVYIYLDPSSGLILRISGDTKYVSNLDVNLKHVVMQ